MPSVSGLLRQAKTRPVIMIPALAGVHDTDHMKTIHLKKSVGGHLSTLMFLARLQHEICNGKTAQAKSHQTRRPAGA